MSQPHVAGAAAAGQTPDLVLRNLCASHGALAAPRRTVTPPFGAGELAAATTVA
ncbi:hypothetical protein [Arthrobacter rhombi]|uniref:hypothetical protein n=1 Tax=Arthrobacter rhombi TaxID=71253 RepID=UPI0031E260EE